MTPATDLDLGISILSKKLENIMDLNQKIKNQHILVARGQKS